jgi:hypothetical protein
MPLSKLPNASQGFLKYLASMRYIELIIFKGQFYISREQLKPFVDFAGHADEDWLMIDLATMPQIPWGPFDDQKTWWADGKASSEHPKAEAVTQTSATPDIDYAIAFDQIGPETRVMMKDLAQNGEIRLYQIEGEYYVRLAEIRIYHQHGVGANYRWELIDFNNMTKLPWIEPGYLRPIHHGIACITDRPRTNLLWIDDPSDEWHLFYDDETTPARPAPQGCSVLSISGP